MTTKGQMTLDKGELITRAAQMTAQLNDATIGSKLLLNYARRANDCRRLFYSASLTSTTNTGI